MKRSSDTRIRREVVGQMLDYAAHAAAYWPMERLRAAFEAEHGDAADPALVAALGVESADELWEKVAAHLDAGRLRLVFVADRIPRELRRVVEFLNGQMDPAEVLAVEIRQFVGDGRKTLVPRVMGLTAAAQAKKGGAGRRRNPWTPEEFLATLRAARPGDGVVAEQIVEWSRSQGLELIGGRGRKHGTLYFVLRKGDEELRPFSFYEDNPREAFLYVYFEGMGPSFADQERRAELCDRFNRIEGVDLSPEKSYPGIALPKLEAEAALETAFGALEWMLARMREEP